MNKTLRYLSALFFVLTIGSVHAATFTVTDAGDAPADPWTYASWAAAPKTLRNAIHFSSTVPGTDNIVLATNVTLAAYNPGAPNRTGKISINKWVDIDGAGHTLNANGSDGFNIASWNGSPDNPEGSIIQDIVITNAVIGINVSNDPGPGSTNDDLVFTDVTIVSPSDKGVYATGSAGMTLTNVHVSDAVAESIHLDGGDAVITDVNITGSGSHGLLLENSVGVTGYSVSGGVITGTQVGNGAHIINVTAGTIDGLNSSANDQDGINVTASSNLVIQNGFFDGNGLNPGGFGEARGIYVGTSDNLTIQGNSFDDNARNGALLSATTNSSVDNNTFNDNGLSGGATDYYHGLSLSDVSTDNTVTRNTMSGNHKNGIEFNVNSDNNVVGGSLANANTVTNNGQIGIAIQGQSSGIEVSYNTVIGNTNDAGIQVNTFNGAINGATITNNVVQNNRIGIQVLDGDIAQDIVITDNNIGADAAGNAAFGNTEDGIQILSQLDGVTVNDNIIVNSGNYGLNIAPTGGSSMVASQISGNRIGVDASDVAAGNGIDGMVINDVNNLTIGGAGALANIVVNSGAHGIDVLNGTGVTVDLNYVGVLDDFTPMDNGANGVVIDGVTNAIVQNTEVYNSGNSGVYVNGSTNFLIENTNLGSDGTSTMGNAEFGVQVESSTGTINNNDIGNNGASPDGGGVIVNGATSAVTISNNNIGFVGIDNDGTGIILNDGTNTVDVNIIVNAEFQGVQVSGGTNTLTGNTIEGHGEMGVLVNGATGTTIGTATAGTGNIINNNGIHGIQFTGGATANTADNNTITNSGQGGVSGNGISIEGADANLIGQNAANTINTSLNHGIYISGVAATDNEVDNNVVENNTENGIAIINAGTGNSLDGNTIGANGTNGIYVEGTGGTEIINNFVGVNATGTTANANLESGIFLTGVNATGTTISQNFVGSNGEHGIMVDQSSGTITIDQNLIGVGTGSVALGNTLNGIEMFNATNHVISNNLISNNVEGLNLNASSQNSVSGNTIGSNSGNGVYISGGSQQNTFEGNYIGIEPSGVDLPNGAGLAGIHLHEGNNNVIGTVGNGNYFGGSTQDYGVLVTGGNSLGTTIEGNVFGSDATYANDRSTAENAILVSGATANVSLIGENIFRYDNKTAVNINTGGIVGSVDQNYFGVDSDGQTDLPGAPAVAVNIESGSNQTTVENNIIPTVSDNAIVVNGASLITVMDNKIGVYADETAHATGVTNDGIYVSTTQGITVTGNTVGTSTNGITFDNVTVGSNSITGNYVGVASDLAGNVANTSTGINIVNSSSSLDVSGNYVGFNPDGIYVNDASATINANFVGTDGTVLFGNTMNGISLEEANTGTAITNNIVGGQTNGSNDASGIYVLNSSLISITGNNVGTDAPSSTTNLANNIGIQIENNTGSVLDNNTISTNTIAFSNVEGVLIDGSQRNLISQNSMYCNGTNNVLVAPGTNDLDALPGSGISLVNGGNSTSATKDFMSPDLQDFRPVVSERGGNYYVQIRQDSLSANGFTETVNGAHTIEVFGVDMECENCQGTTYLGNAVANTLAPIAPNPAVEVYEMDVTAFYNPLSPSKFVLTVTRTDNSTSHFTACTAPPVCIAPNTVVLDDITNTTVIIGGMETSKICENGNQVDFETTVDGTSNNAGFNYAWYIENVEDANTTFNFTGISGAQKATYVVRAYALSDDGTVPQKFKDVAACYLEDSIEVWITENPVFTLTTGADYCNGDNTTISVNMTTGDYPYTFDWVDDQAGTTTETVTLSADTTFDYGPANATAATVTHTISLASLTDSNGCAALDLTPTDAFDVFPTPVATITADDASICPTTSTMINVNLTQGNPLASYDADVNVNDGTTTTTTTHNAGINPYSFSVSPTTATTYTLESVTDGNNCTATFTGVDVTVGIFPEVSGSFDADNIICKGTVVTMGYTFDGVAPYTFDYDTNGTAVIGQAAPTNTGTVNGPVSAATTTTYTLTRIEDANGCEAAPADLGTTRTITVTPVPTPTIVTGDECINLTGQASVTPITGGNTYAWTITGGTGAATIASSTSPNTNINLDAPGTIDLEVVETAGIAPNQCVGTATATLTINDTVSFDISFVDDCQDPTGTYDPSLASNHTLTINSGVMSTIDFSPMSFSLASAGTKTVTTTIENADGCVNTKNASFTVHATPIVNINGVADQCEANSTPINLTASLNPTGGTETWSGPGVSGSTFNANTATSVGSPHTITLDYTDLNGCQNSATTSIVVNPMEIASVSLAQTNVVCESAAQSFTATPTHGGTNPIYTWEYKVPGGVWTEITGQNGPSVDYTPSTPADDIRVSLTSSLSCVDDALAGALVPVDVIREPNPYITSSGDICEDPTGADQIVLSAFASGATPGNPTSFTWYKRSNSEVSFTQVGTGDTYTVSGIDAGTHTFYVSATNTHTGTGGTCSGQSTQEGVEVIQAKILAQANGSAFGANIKEGNSVALTTSFPDLDDISWSNFEWTIFEDSEGHYAPGEQVGVTRSTAHTPEYGASLNYVTYQVSATKSGLCDATDTVTVRIVRDCFVPNGFTPNGDGQNDTWVIDCLNWPERIGEYPSATVKIYNRWGELIYKDEAGYIIPWDGTRNGSDVPVGTYYFVIDLNFDGEEPIAGAVAIMK